MNIPGPWGMTADPDIAAADIDAIAARLFGGCAQNAPYLERARAITQAAIAALDERDPDVAGETAMAAGTATATWAHDRALSRIETLLVDLPERVAPERRTAARERIARFVGGYLEGIFTEDAAWNYEFTAVIVRRLGTARSIGEIAHVAVDAVTSSLDADAAWVVERHDTEWAFIAQRGLRVWPGSETVSSVTIDAIEALASGESVVYADFTEAPPHVRRLAQRQELQTALLIPLMIEGECAAIVGFGRREAHAFTSRETAFAGILCAQIGARLRELRAQARSREAFDALQASEKRTVAQLAEKVRAVDILQHAYIPRALPANPHLRFDALYLPADDEARVGGDWYDVFDLDDGRLLFSVGDVAGHGLDAAVTMGIIRQAIRIAATGAVGPSDILVAVNRSVLAQRLSVTTAVVGIYDPQTHVAQYACAGHPPPLFVDASGVHALGTGGLPLGIEPVAAYPVEPVHLDDDMALIFYTDGLIEQSRDILAGIEQLLTVVSALPRANERDNWAALIADRVLSGPANDDLAILTMRALSPSSGSGINSVQTHRDTMAWDIRTSDVYAIALARNQFIAFLGPLVTSNGDLLSAEIVLGELLSNAVEHAPGTIHIELAWDGATPLAIVRDRGPGGVKPARLPNDELSEHGRGMFLISTLAQRTRIERDVEGGTSITAWLNLERNDRTTS